MIPDEWLDQAVERLAGRVERTPLTYDEDNNLFIKWENRQITGSFKIRGALNKILALKPQQKENGLVAASAGNHGQGVALAAGLVGARAIVFASEHAVPSKVRAMQELGAQVRLVAGGYAEAEKAAMQFAVEQHATWISPYNDGQIIAGQGTLGLEIIAQLASRQALTCLVPAGGGGLAAGIGVAIQRFPHRMSLVAVQSEASPFLHAIYQNGSQESIVEQDSIADGLSGPVEAGSLTIPMVRRYVDGFELVSEEEIARAIAYAWRHYREKIEGSAATALAAVLTNKVAERPAVVVITGGNIQPELHQQICESWRTD